MDAKFFWNKHPRGAVMEDKMSNEQELVILYLKYHEGETAEDVLNALSSDSLGHRLAIANALEYLVWNGFIHKDLVTGELTLKEGAR